MAPRMAKRMARSAALVALLTAGATASGGCTIRPDAWPTRTRRWLDPQVTAWSPASQRPTLTLSDAEVEAALARGRARTDAQTARVEQALAQPARRSLAGLADELACCYATGAEAAAARLEAAHPALLPFDRAGELVEVSGRYARYGDSGLLELTVTRRPGVTGALAVAVPPGTLALPVRSGPGQADPVQAAPAFGAPAPLAVGGDGHVRPRWTAPDLERRFGHWPPAQDLALLRAPVILLPEGQGATTVTVPVACASFHLGGPQVGQPYLLQRAERDSALTRLLVRLCAEPAREAESQLAVWLTRDDISWEAFVAQGGAWGRLVTFQQQQSVLPRHAQGAARILLEAGLDPRPLRFFGGDGGPLVAPAPEPAPPEQAPAPEPTQPPTPADLRV